MQQKPLVVTQITEPDENTNLNFMNMKKSLGKSQMGQQLKVKSNARNGPSELHQPGQYSQNQYTDNSQQLQLKLNVTEQEHPMHIGGGSFDGRNKV